MFCPKPGSVNYTCPRKYTQPMLFQQNRFGVKILISGTVTLLLLFSIYLFSGASDANLSTFLPESMALAIEAKTPDLFLQANADRGGIYFENLKKNDWMQAAVSDLNHLFTLCSAIPGLNAQLKKAALTLSFSTGFDATLAGVWCLKLDQTPNLSSFLKFNKWTKFKGYTLYNCSAGSAQPLVLARIGRFFFCSRKASLIEEIIGRYDSGQKPTIPQKWRQQIGNEVAWRMLIHTEIEDEEENTNLAALAFPSWVVFEFRKDRLRWETESNAFDETVEPDWLSVLPNNLTGFAVFKMPEKKNNDIFYQYIKPWSAKNFGVFDLAGQRILLIPVAQAPALEVCLMRYAEKNGAIQEGTYQMFREFSFMEPGLTQALLPEQWKGYKTPVVALLDGFVLIAEERSILEICLDKYIVNQTLASNESFLQLRSHAHGRMGMYLAAHSGPEEDRSIWGKIMDYHSRFYFSLDASGSRSGAILVQAGGEKLAPVDLLWKTAFQAPLKRVGLVSSETAGPKLMVQDGQNGLYCMDLAGKITWKRQLDQPVISELSALDDTKGGAPIYLFNTASALYLLDVDGNNVPGFPIKLQSAASNGVVAVDFEKNRKYALFLCCDNGNAYGFDQNGKPLSGWNPLPGIGIVRRPLLHFQAQNEDFLAIQNQTGRVHVLNRNGNTHFEPVKVPELSILPLWNHSNQFILMIGASGTVYRLDLNGKLSHETSGGVDRSCKAAAIDSQNEIVYLLDQQGIKIQDFGNRNKGAWPIVTDTLYGIGSGQIGVFDKRRRVAGIYEWSGKPAPGFPMPSETPLVIVSDKKMLILAFDNILYAYKVLNVTI